VTPWQQQLVDRRVRLTDNHSQFELMAGWLDEALRQTDSSGLLLEVGTLRGGSALLTLDFMAALGQRDRWLLTIDPYGATRLDTYREHQGEEHYRQFLLRTAELCEEEQLHHVHFRERSDDWIAHANEFVLYDRGQRRQLRDERFAWVYLDGEHTREAVEMEVDFFRRRMASRGRLVVDDATGHDKWLDDKLRGDPNVESASLYVNKYAATWR